MQVLDDAAASTKRYIEELENSKEFNERQLEYFVERLTEQRNKLFEIEQAKEVLKENGIV